MARLFQNGDRVRRRDIYHVGTIINMSTRSIRGKHLQFLTVTVDGGSAPHEHQFVSTEHWPASDCRLVSRR